MKQQAPYHESKIFSGMPQAEWLIYVRATYKTFAVSVLGQNERFSLKGSYDSDPRYLEMSIKCLSRAKQLEVHLKQDQTASRQRRFFGTAPLVGSLEMANEVIGSVKVGRAYDVESPVISIDSKSLGWHLAVHRADARNILCPLLVYGIPECEMVLESGVRIEPARAKFLPRDPPKQDFVGSCRSVTNPLTKLDEIIEGVGLMSAIYELLVRRYIMEDF